MASKAIVFLGLFLAVALLMSSEVAARDLAETSSITADTFVATNGAADGVEFSEGKASVTVRCRYRVCCTRYSCRCCFAGEKMVDNDAQTTQAQTQN